MTDVRVRFRDPFTPHRVLAEPEVSDLSYAFVLLGPGRATFRIPRSTPQLPQALRLGAMVTVERSDEVLQWVGFVTDRDLSLSESAVSYVCSDHAGAVLSNAVAPRDWPEMRVGSSEAIRRVFADADQRESPPLDLDISTLIGGTPLVVTPRAETLISFLQTLAKTTGWEWGLRHQVTRDDVRSALLWQERLGDDLAASISFDEGDAFVAASLTEATEGFVRTGIAIGGSGSVAKRPFAVSSGPPPADSPAMASTRVLVQSAVTGADALERAAVRLRRAPESVRQRLTLQLAEGRIDVARLGIGSTYLVRFKTLDLGLGLETSIRCLGLGLGTDGVIEMVAEVEP